MLLMKKRLFLKMEIRIGTVLNFDEAGVYSVQTNFGVVEVDVTKLAVDELIIYCKMVTGLWGVIRRNR